MTTSDEISIPPRSLPLALGAGLVAIGVACAVFWSFDYPWTLRGDNKAVMFPMNLEAFRFWMSGRPPEWTDKIWAGFPLLADPTSMSLYWPNFVGFLLTPAPHFRAYDLATALHSGILVSGVVYLLRILGVRALASMLGGVLIFIAPMHVWYASSMITGYAPVTWWPWLLVAAELISRRGLSPGPLALGWVSLASCALVYPEFALYGGTVAAAWLVTRRGNPVYRRILCALILLLGGVALAAPQLLPTAFFVPETTRGTNLSEIRRFDITQIFFAADTFLYPGTEEIMPSFLGVATLILAFAGALSRGPRTAFLAGLALVSFLLALGFDTPLYSALRSLPGFGMFRQAMKFKLLTELAVVLLVAFGIDSLLRRNSDSNGRIFVVLILALSLMEHFTYVALRVPTGISLPGADDDSFTVLYERMMNSAVIRSALRSPQLPGPRINDRLRLRSLPMIEGVATLRGGPNALLPERHRRIVDAFNTYEGPTKAAMDYMGVHYDLAGDLGVSRSGKNKCLESAMSRRVLLTGRYDDTCLYWNNDRPNRYVVARGARLATDLDSMIDSVADELAGARLTLTKEIPGDSCIADEATTTEAIVETLDLRVRDQIPVVAPIAEIRKRSRPFGRAGVVDYKPGEVDLLAVSNRAGFLVAKESYFSGWKATVDTEPVPIYPAAGLFFAVPIPSGQHEIRLTFESPGFRLGVRIALAWVAAACLSELLRRIYTSRRAGQSRQP